MKTLTCFAAAILALTVSASDVAGTTRLTIAPRSTLLLNGTSNVTRWRCSGSTLTGLMEVAAPLQKINEVIDHVEDGQIAIWMANPEAARFPQPRFDLTIPIDALRCSGGRRMERDMVAALKADRYPAIHVRFVELRGAVQHDIDQRLYRVVVQTEVSLAGVTRALELVVTAERVANDRFRIRAELPLRMTDFGVTPPKALFGIVRAGDRLTVELNLLLEAESHG